MATSSGHHDDNNNKTVDFVVYDDQHNFAAPSGPCMVCGRPSEYPSPFKEDAFECEFLCGWPVPRDIRERLRLVKEQEERRDAESYGYEADDEKEDDAQDTAEVTVSVTVRTNNNIGDEMDGFPSQAHITPKIADHHDKDSPVGSHDTSKVSLHSEAAGGMADAYVDADNVDVYEEMHKTLFPGGVPWPQIRPTTPRSVTNRVFRHNELQITSSGKRKSEDGNGGSVDRPAKKQKIVSGPSRTVSKEPMEYFRLGGRHNLLGLKSRSSLADVLFGYRGDER